MQKLARAVIGTNNIDNCSRYCQAPATTGLFRTVGYGGDSGSIRDIENAGLVLIIGSNTAESHPVLATRVKRAHKLRGQKLIVADLREHEMARRADVFLHPQPGTDLVWLSAITRYILDNGLAEQAFINQWVNGVDEYRKEPGTLHAGIGRERLRACRRNLEEGRPHDRGGGRRLHPLGHGRHAAHHGFGYVHRDLESAAGHRQLHAAGHRRVSLARPQQRAGRQRPRRDAELLSRAIKRSTIQRFAASSRRRGMSRCRRTRA